MYRERAALPSHSQHHRHPLELVKATACGPRGCERPVRLVLPLALLPQSPVACLLRRQQRLVPKQSALYQPV